MFQLPDVVTLIKDFGIVAVLSIACSYLAYILIRFVAVRTIKKVLEEHNAAISHIKELLDSVKDPKTNKILSRMEVILVCNDLLSRFTETAEEMAKRCELETCPHLNTIIDIIVAINNKLNAFIEKEENARELARDRSEKYVSLVLERINIINTETKELTHSLLSLMRSFINRTLISEEEEKNRGK